MNKKANSTVIIFVVIIVVIISIIALVLTLSNKDYFNRSGTQNTEEMIPFFLQAKTIDKTNTLDANYQIFSVMNVTNNDLKEVSSGKLKEGFNELSVPRNNLILSTCWNDEHYLVKAFKVHDQKELASNKSSLSCNMPKIGNLTITHEGEINGVVDEIRLNISVDNWFYKPTICFGWTSGFKSISRREDFVICESNWRNKSSVGDSWVGEENQYLCGSDWYETCEFISGNKCKQEGSKIPTRLANLVDSCSYLGRNLNKESIEIILDIESYDNKNYLDEITIFVLDKDRRWNKNEQTFTWAYEWEDKDIGAKDVEYRIDYFSNCGENTCTI